jgi:hypothetical protein
MLAAFVHEPSPFPAATAIVLLLEAWHLPYPIFQGTAAAGTPIQFRDTFAKEFFGQSGMALFRSGDSPSLRLRADRSQAWRC